MINILKQSTAVSLATGQVDSLSHMKLLLVDIQSNLTPAIAHQAPKLFQLRKAERLGERELMKLLVFLLKAFQDSLKVKDGMEAADLIETAEMILAKYSHDSLKDIMLALKEAKWNGHNFYNALSGPKVMEVLHLYFDTKAQRLEAEHRQQKAQPEPDLLTSIPPAMADGLLKGITPPKPRFDEAEYQRQKATYYAQRIVSDFQEEESGCETLTEADPQAA